MDDRCQCPSEYRQIGYRIAKPPASRRLLPALPELNARRDVRFLPAVLHSRSWVDAHERVVPNARLWRAHNHIIKHSRPQLAVCDGLPRDCERRTWVAHAGWCGGTPPARRADVPPLRALDIDAVVRADICVRVYAMMTYDDDTYLFITPGIMPL